MFDESFTQRGPARSQRTQTTDEVDLINEFGRIRISNLFETEWKSR